MELLSPAGSLDKLKIALEYGADAVYAGLPDFSLRAKTTEFNASSLEEGIRYTKKLDKKIYLTLNIFAHNDKLKTFQKQISFLKKTQPHAVIFSDPGLFSLLREKLPQQELHLSTQANCTNWKHAEFWFKQGVKRIILARELTLKEISEIHRKVPKLELEIFVHGAMCMSYSGRCLLSLFLTGRDANQGDCAHACRWQYKVHTSPLPSLLRRGEIPAPLIEGGEETYLPPLPRENRGRVTTSSLAKGGQRGVFLEEEFRPGEFIPLEEDQHGTYLFSSKDLCMIEYLAKMQKAGICSLKIEGRSKTAYYVAAVTRAYRQALDHPKNEKLIQELRQELETISHREYSTGFYFNPPRNQQHPLNCPPDKGGEGGCFSLPSLPRRGRRGLFSPLPLYKGKIKRGSQDYSGHYTSTHTVISRVVKYHSHSGLAEIEVLNQIKLNDQLEILTPGQIHQFQVTELFSLQKQPLTIAHGGHKNILLKTSCPLEPDWFLRKKL